MMVHLDMDYQMADFDPDFRIDHLILFFDYLYQFTFVSHVIYSDYSYEHFCAFYFRRIDQFIICEFII